MAFPEENSPPSGRAARPARFFAHPSVQWAIALMLGALTVSGFAPDYLSFLPPLTLAALSLLWSRAASRRAAAHIGFAFGLGFFGAGVSWVYVSIHDFGGMPGPIAAVATFLFCLVLSLFPSAVGLLQSVSLSPSPLPPALKDSDPLRAKARAESYAGEGDEVSLREFHANAGGLTKRRALLSIPVWWVAMEWVKGWILTGFPWLTLGYSQVAVSPLAGFAPVFGVYGVSLAAALCAGALALLADGWLGRRGKAQMALPAALVVGLAAAGWGLQQVTWVQPIGAPVAVSLLQGNIAQEMKWREDKAQSTLDAYLALTQASTGRLIVLPETALPMFLHQVPLSYLEMLAEHARRRGGDVLVGVPEYTESRDYFNSVVSLGSAPVQVYRKYHLVPFGEYIPLKPLFGWIVHILHIPLSDFARGAPVQAPLQAAGQKVAVAVCYEDVFGEELIRQLPAATLLVNVSNDAWFGDTVAPWQHLQISQMRALETGRYMLRATNTGITAIIDQRGEVVKRAQEFAVAVLEGEAQGFSGATPYVRWGNFPLLGLLALLLAADRLAGRTPTRAGSKSRRQR